MTNATDTWIRIAGNAKRIRTEGDPYHWRCFVGRQGPEIPLRTFQTSGPSTAENMIPGTDPTGANLLGLVAWIDYFGDVEIEDGVARITLKPR